MSDADTYSCTVYPDSGGNFTIPNCIPQPVSKYSGRNIRLVESKEVTDPETLQQVFEEPNHPEISSEQKDIISSERGGPLPYNATTNTYLCPSYNPNGRFCVGGHRASIIIRCHNGIGQAGNCNNDLVGSPPVGNAYSPCWETSPISGDAACSKK